MQYTTTYQSPLGEILLACDDIGLTGLWFYEQKYFAAGLSSEYKEVKDMKKLPFPLTESIRWLNLYFSGVNPSFTPPLHLTGTQFRMDVWNVLLTIPYGETMTYGEIAKILARQRGLTSMSAQAVGNAVGHNPISIIVPCHRVLGSDGKLTGYAGGIPKKEALLKSEEI